MHKSSNYSMINTNWPSRIQGHESICFIHGLFSIQIKTHNEESFTYRITHNWGWEVFSIFFRIYESFYELSVNIIGSEGSANGQTKVENAVWECRNSDVGYIVMLTT